MENEIKPKVLHTVANLSRDYNKLIKYQKEKLERLLSAKIFSPTKEKSYQKIVSDILEKYKITSTVTSCIGRISSKTLY